MEPGPSEDAPPSRTPSQASGSSDWPRWRGVNLDGISKERGLLRSWPDGGPPLVWQVEGLGTGFASVSVADGKIYTMGRWNNTEHLIALSADDGSRLWATPVGPGRNQRGSNCTPTVDGDLVYAISIEGDLICARTDNGQPVWNKNFAHDFGGRMMSEWGFSESPLVDGPLVICTPVVFDDFVFCSTGYGTGSALLRIVKGGGRVQVQEQYFLSADRLQNHHGGMILVDGHLYCGHGHNNGFPICLDVRSGRLAWGGDLRGPGTGSAAIAYAEGQLYFRYQNGIMALIEASPRGYQLNGSFRLPSVRAESWPQPVIANGRLYLRDQEVLMCYDVRAN